LQPEKKSDAKAELNRRSQACEVLAGTGVRVARKEKLVEHEGSAPSTPVWKTGMFLSTPMLEIGSLLERA
jgi:hypothetical protein